MIRNVVAAGLGAVVSVVTLRAVARRGGERLVAAPRTTPDEAELGGALDALGGCVDARNRSYNRRAGSGIPRPANPD